jgi:tetratricopeptide (TPR) repeat protein
MAKKKPKRGKKPKRARRRRPADLPLDLPDRRALEGVFAGLLGGGGRAGGDPTLREAQNLVYQAFDEPDDSRRVRLARQALEACPDCADAYVLLGEYAATRREALDLYARGVAAGERALGKRAFRADVGHFWGLLETRPYMRARMGLANLLWQSARQEDAVGHWQEMLRLNPNDNQGVRYVLADALLRLDRDDDLVDLIELYGEDASARWAYTRALLAFRRQGDTPEARDLLRRAKKANRHVPAYLLGEMQLPPEPPEYHSFGDKNEAVDYAAGAMASWRGTPSAVAWLREAGKAKRKSPRGPAPHDPLPIDKERLRGLPRTGDAWQADAREVATYVHERGRLTRPWMVLVADRSQGVILRQQMGTDQPTAELVWDVVSGAMRKPLVGPAQRPLQLEVPEGPPWTELRPHFEEVGVRLVEARGLDMMDALFADLAEHLGREEGRGLLDVPGLTQEGIGRFYDAAAGFFEQAPWKAVGGESAIRIACEQFAGGPRYAVLMGQVGMTFGLALYEDFGELRRLWSGELTEGDGALATTATAVSFDEETNVAPAEVDAARRQGWRLARPDAYPVVYRTGSGELRPPTPEELGVAEACLRALPDFVCGRRPDDPATETVRVPTALGERTLTLGWVEE